MNGDKLLFHRDSGTQKNKDCGSAETSKPLAPADFTHTYSLGKNADGEDELSFSLSANDTSPMVLRRR